MTGEVTADEIRNRCRNRQPRRVGRKYPAVAADLRALAASVRHVAPAGADPG